MSPRLVRSHVLISSTVRWPSPSLSPPASMTRSTRVSCSPCVLRPSTSLRADLSSAFEIFPSPSTSRAASSSDVISPSPSTSSQPRILRQISWEKMRIFGAILVLVLLFSPCCREPAGGSDSRARHQHLAC